MDGVHVTIISDRAGHSKIETTLTVYATYIRGLQANAAMRVDAWLKDGVKNPGRGNPRAGIGWEISLRSALARLQVIDFTGIAGLAQR
jgi:hypothetical protein